MSHLCELDTEDKHQDKGPNITWPQERYWYVSSTRKVQLEGDAQRGLEAPTGSYDEKDITAGEGLKAQQHEEGKHRVWPEPEGWSPQAGSSQRHSPGGLSQA